MPTETYFNDFGTTLTSFVDNSQTSIVLNNVSAYPNPFTGLQVHIRIDDEIMLVTAVNTSTNTLTVVRAQETTTAVSHASGSQVVHILTAAALSQIVNQNGTITAGTQASLPGSQTYSGQSYWGTDRPYINLWNGSSYTQYYARFAVPPPVAASWTQINFSGNATLTDTAGGVSLVATGGSNSKVAVIAAPTPPYKVAMHFRMCQASNDSNSWCGAYWTTNTTSTSPFMMAVIRGNGNYINYNGTNISSPSYTSIYDPGGPTMGVHGNDFYIVFDDNGTTNRTVYNSNDGYNYVVSSGWPRTRGENSGMNHIGFGHSGSTLGAITLLSYRVF